MYSGDTLPKISTLSFKSVNFGCVFPPNQMTPLHMAVRNAHIKVVKYLVEQGTADVNIQDNEGVNKISVAA